MKPIFRLFILVSGWPIMVGVFLLVSTAAFAQTPAYIQSEHLLKVDLMFVGAHPDDESGVTATFAREVERGARAAIVLATRGEGGGNAIGRQLGPSLGLLREAELRRATAEYGVNLVYFLDKTDFFYTLSTQAAFDVWDHDDALERLVRLVRLLRPDVMVTMWPGPGTHGMHQAAGRLATEAFTAAADTNAFPKQIAEEFLELWQPKKLYYNTGQPGAVRISSSDISPVRFMSYGEIKALALRNYRSQGFDRFATLPPQQAGAESFLLVKARVQVSDNSTNLLDGVMQPVDRTITLTPPPDDPATVQIVPRKDVAAFRRWAVEHDVAWAAGLLPVSRSIGVGLTDTVHVEVRNRRNATLDGALTLTLPSAWNIKPETKPYKVSPEGNTLVPFVVTAPPGIAQSDYPIRVSTMVGGIALTDSGYIDVLPVMTLTQPARTPVIDGALSDWRTAPSYPIPSENIWSGALTGGDADCSGTVRVMYDANYVYVAVEVTDDAVVTNIAPDDVKGHWRSNAVEICVDPSGQSGDNTLSVFKAGIFPGTTAGRQARAARDADARQGVIEKTAPGMRVASRFTDTGYIIETSIPWRDMPGGRVPADGHTMGFNVVIYDGDDTQAGVGANIGKARLGWSFRPSAQALPYYYGRAVVR